MIKKILCVLITVFIILISAAGCHRTNDDTLTVSIKSIKAFGSLVLDTTFEEMNEAGIETGDIISLGIEDHEYDVPVGTLYTDVDIGEMICRFDLEDNEVILAVNYAWRVQNLLIHANLNTTRTVM